jgi:hypothetical protein
MPRLLGFLLVLLAGIGLVRWLSRQNQQANSRDRKTFRPRRPSPFGASNESDSASINDIYAMSRSSVSSVCDALTGAPINTHGKVWRCVNCQSLYNLESVIALEKDNDSACVQCSNKTRGLVTFTDD